MAIQVVSVRGDVVSGRMHLNVSDLSPGMKYVAVYRYIDKQTPVRLRDVYRRRNTSKDPANPVWVIEEPATIPPPYDFECPVNVWVGYAAVEWATGSAPKAPAEPQARGILNVPGSTAWITDPGAPTKNFRITCLLEVPPRTYRGNIGIFRPIGRSKAVSVSMPRNDWEGNVAWMTHDAREEEMCRDLLSDGGVVIFRTGATYGSINVYVQPMDVEVSPLSVQKLPHRRWSMPLTVTDAPIGARLLEEGMTYDDFQAVDVTADKVIYQDIFDMYENYYFMLRGESRL
jgi:hypothetical protein